MTPLNDIVFERQVGGLKREAESEDVISGLIMLLGAMPFASGSPFTEIEVTPQIKMFVAKIRYFEELAEIYGVEESEITYTNGVLDTGQGVQLAKNAVVYHTQEFFRQSPTGELWLGVTIEGDGVPKEAILALQNKAQGKIRQLGVFTPKSEGFNQYQYAAAGDGIEKGLEQMHRPLSIVVGPSKEGLTLSNLLSANPHFSDTESRKNLSLLIACDLDARVLSQLGEGQYGYYGCVGNVLGAISASRVNESIAWVGKFKAGLKKPGLITGELLDELSDTDLNVLNDNRYIFVRYVEGISGNYFNDSHTLDPVTSDYAYIENVRTMDKAVREIRKKLVPFLNSPIAINSSTGTLADISIANLENVANSALEEMEKRGEISGHRVAINPDQNVLATGEIEFQIQKVPIGVVRRMRIKIGFTQKLD